MIPKHPQTLLTGHRVLSGEQGRINMHCPALHVSHNWIEPDTLCDNPSLFSGLSITLGKHYRTQYRDEEEWENQSLCFHTPRLGHSDRGARTAGGKFNSACSQPQQSAFQICL